MEYKGKPAISSLKGLKCTSCKSKDVVIERVTDDTSDVTDHKTIWFNCLYCGLHGHILYIKENKWKNF